MKSIIAALLLLPSVCLGQWSAVRVSSTNNSQAIQENFRRAAVYSNRKLDRFAPETIYGTVNISSNVYIVGFSSATKYYGDGSSLTGVATSAVSTVTIDALPIGSFIQYGSTTAPSSYLYCDGTSYSTTTYSALYAVIGYKYGGSGANFTCDFRGMFARGLDTTGTIDGEARVIGSSETDKFQGHIHPDALGTTVSPTGTGQTIIVGGAGPLGRIGSPTTDGTNGTPRTGNETRPKNIAVAVMVKYQNPVVNYNGLASSNTWSGTNIFTATGSANVQISSLTVGALQFGTGPSIMTKYFSGTTGASTGADTNVAHGLTQANILFVQIRILNSDNLLIQPSYAAATDTNYFSTYTSATNVVISVGASASKLTSRPYTVLMWYKP